MKKINKWLNLLLSTIMLFLIGYICFKVFNFNYYDSKTSGGFIGTTTYYINPVRGILCLIIYSCAKVIYDLNFNKLKNNIVSKEKITIWFVYLVVTVIFWIFSILGMSGFSLFDTYTFESDLLLRFHGYVMILILPFWNIVSSVIIYAEDKIKGEVVTNEIEKT